MNTDVLQRRPTTTLRLKRDGLAYLPGPTTGAQLAAIELLSHETNYLLHHSSICLVRRHRHSAGAWSAVACAVLWTAVEDDLDVEDHLLRRSPVLQYWNADGLR